MGKLLIFVFLFFGVCSQAFADGTNVDAVDTESTTGDGTIAIGTCYLGKDNLYRVVGEDGKDSIVPMREIQDKGCPRTRNNDEIMKAYMQVEMLDLREGESVTDALSTRQKFQEYLMSLIQQGGAPQGCSNAAIDEAFDMRSSYLSAGVPDGRIKTLEIFNDIYFPKLEKQYPNCNMRALYNATERIPRNAADALKMMKMGRVVFVKDGEKISDNGYGAGSKTYIVLPGVTGAQIKTYGHSNVYVPSGSDTKCFSRNFNNCYLLSGSRGQKHINDRYFDGF